MEKSDKFLLTIAWLIGVSACIVLVITLQIIKPNDWFVHFFQLLIIGKMFGFTYMYKNSWSE